MLILEEILVNKLLPGIRTYIVKKHDPRIMTWSELARRLGVTPTAVTKYMNHSINEYISDELLEKIKDDIETLRTLIYKPGLTPELLNEKILETWIKWVSKGIICKYIQLHRVHRFTECRKLTSLYSEFLINRAIIEVDQAFNIFRKIPSIKEYIPEVSTNITRLVEIGDDPWKYPVIGFPGRIVVINNEIMTYDRPRVGGSKHMGGVLRKLHMINRHIYGLTGIAYNHRIKEAARKLELEYKEIEALSDEEIINKLNEAPDIILDKGGYGRVGFAYISGNNSVDAVNKLKKIIMYLGGY